MSKAYRVLRRAWWTTCADHGSGLQNAFPALAARFAACAASAHSKTSCKSAPTSLADPPEEPGRADAAVSTSASGFQYSQNDPGKRGDASKQACIPILQASAGSRLHSLQGGCRSFSAQPLPLKHAEGPEPLGFVKGGYSVEQFPPDKVFSRSSARLLLLLSSLPLAERVTPFCNPLKNP